MSAMKKNDIIQKKVEQKKSMNQERDQDNNGDKDKVKLEDEDQIKPEVKLENEDVESLSIQAPKKWYEDDNLEIDDDKKWDYLEHHGVTFPDPYIPKKLHVSYNGKQVP